MRSSKTTDSVFPYIDTDIDPAEDFYGFVNGGWLSKTEIPSDRSSWGSFHELSKETDAKVLDILNDELMTPGPSRNLAARLFESGMDTVHIDQRRFAAVHPFLKIIDDLTRIEDLPFLLGSLVANGLAGIMAITVYPDLGDSKKYAAYLEPAPLGLPETDFYLDEDDKAKAIRSAYVSYINDMLTEGDGRKETVIAAEVVKFESALAQHTLSKEDRRQINNIYNPYAFNDFVEAYPFDWHSFFRGAGIPAPERLIVTDVGFFEKILPLLSQQSLETIKMYLRFMVLHLSAPYAHSKAEQLHFDLYFKLLEGIEVMKPRHERVIKVVNVLLGEALGQLFVSKHFPQRAKAAALEMTEDIVQAFKERIRKLDWMQPSTREYALSKLDAIRVKIGYPDQWKEYKGLEVTPNEDGGDYLLNILHATIWKFKDDARRIGKEVDREEWFMAPQVVNAYYNPLFNEIVFPAAILQPPFFDWMADAAVNYGGIGAVIGHEITHGFDDQGSRFDKEGNYNEWWTEADRHQFESKTKALISQFDAYSPFEDLSLNGSFTLGENIADLGGLSVAYDALQLYIQRHGTPAPVDGFSADQRFFMSWATVWRTKIRPEALRNQIKTDPHPPGQYRAIAAPSNLDSFYQAFTVNSKSPWFRPKEDRIRIW